MKRTIKSESGRSMVEMLGVLAIIGVLSIGGIAGYTMAMNRFRANEAIDIANKYAALVFAQNQTLLARTGTGYAETDATLGTAGGTAAPSIRAVGLVTTAAGAGGDNEFNGSTFAITAGGIDNDGVEITITFPTEAICAAGRNILAEEAACNGAALTHEFRQS